MAKKKATEKRASILVATRNKGGALEEARINIWSVEKADNICDHFNRPEQTVWGINGSCPEARQISNMSVEAFKALFGLKLKKGTKKQIEIGKCSFAQ